MNDGRRRNLGKIAEPHLTGGFCWGLVKTTISTEGRCNYSIIINKFFKKGLNLTFDIPFKKSSENIHYKLSSPGGFKRIIKIHKIAEEMVTLKTFK